jgi:threonine dehydratase
MTDNEIAKMHIRHMVGGRAVEATDEVVYRFEFPERPGALMQFLDKLGGRWNISMFHYRNHGAAYGRILVGLQVTAGERTKVAAFLNDLGYNWVEETDNPAYKVFLK